MSSIQLTKRQEKIVEIVKNSGPITSEQIAKKLNLTRATLRPDLTILTMAGILEARPRVGYFYSGKSPRALIAEELRKLRVKDVKAVPVVVREGTSVYDAVVTMFLEDVGTLIVVNEEGFLEGVISRKDLLKVTLGQTDIHKVPVSVMMTRMPNIITTFPEETVYMAAKKLIEHEVDALPVVRTLVDSEGKEKLEVVGRITKTHITRLFVELGEAE
ncbi:helix-turn-helix transcriptional regulator [Calderihabitans maritimus]|uniref:Transcriptional regulator n=1 Tax=Calderihabitans maritimus TaxID=1246530 RepID=A0A1Z5HV62_9FIRM|nr:helix-turn-helix transcriptional regulator [Calderihabitans maritimus]GAW93423.1 transcriptional regulator [Calderihabitans maritimus]